VIYLLALIGAGTIAAAVWAAFRQQQAPTGGSRPIAPDDDPEFLRRLNERRRPPEE
jgi:hypothetical protein